MMWFETLRKAVKEIEKILKEAEKTDSQKELNAMELRIHKIFQEVYAVLGSATREVKATIQKRKTAAKKEFQRHKFIKEEEVLEEVIRKAPAQKVIDASKLEEKPKKKRAPRKKKTDKKVEK